MNSTSRRVSLDKIRGIRKLPEFITSEEDKELRLFAGNQRHWDRLGAKWRLPFGWIYVVSRKTVSPGLPVPPLLRALALRVVDAGLMDQVPDQIVYQVYRSGQYLHSHVDAPIFRAAIVSVSMLSPCVMRFRHPALGPGPDLELEPRCAVAISDEARTDWQHEILKVPATRWSLTFRRVAC
jgi:alkylated DNA repair dioxygenase AlkB